MVSTQPQGMVIPFEASGLALLIALPVLSAAGFGAAACGFDPHIGGPFTRLIRSVTASRIGIAPVVVGTGILVIAVLAGYRPTMWTMAIALIALNLQGITARFAHALEKASPIRVQAAAAGAGPVHVLARVIAATAAPALLAALLVTGAEMLGQNAAIAVAARAALAPHTGAFNASPLAVDLWTRSSVEADRHILAAGALLIVLVILALRLLAAVLERQQARAEAA
jgi:phosphate transport system permease protein